MTRVMAVNGSPRMERGDTEMVLAAFLHGMREAGAETETVYPSRLKIRPCDCGEMRCWFKRPGECHHADDMRDLYGRLSQAEIVVLATPVYVPLPGDMQHFLNRLTPLLDPAVRNRNGRTRARLRSHVQIKKFVLVSTGGWWEKENFGSVVRTVEELAENAGVEFAGPVLRPHASVMKRDGELTPDGRSVLRAAELAGRELIENGSIRGAILEEVGRPLISRQVYDRWFNQSAAAAGDETDG